MRVWVACALSLVVIGCRPEPERLNVVLFVVDTLRADRLGVYGYGGSTSPNIDALAATGVVFEQAEAPAPWTLPSVPSLLLSQLPCEHGLLDEGDRLAEGAEPLAVVLKQSGYRTASFFCNPFAGPLVGLDAGYDTCLLVKGAVDRDTVSGFLDAPGAGRAPFFLYAHNVEPHNPDTAKPRFIRRFGDVSSETVAEVEADYREYRGLTRVDGEAGRPLGSTDNTTAQQRVLSRLLELKPQIDVLYDATVLEADERIGSVIEALRARGLWENTLFIVTSDHGEELGERGGWQHDQSVYEELLHVPLVVRFPEDQFAGTRVSAPVGLIDVAPTLLEVLGVEAPAAYRGRSLLPLLSGKREPGREPRFLSFRHNVRKYYRPYKETRGDVNVVVRRGTVKAIWNAEVDTVELYDLARDRGETTNLAGEHPDAAAGLRDFARRALARCVQSGAGRGPASTEQMDEETRRRLESLGYLDRPQ